MIPTKDDLVYEVCSALGRSEDDAVLLADKLLQMFVTVSQNSGKPLVSGSLLADERSKGYKEGWAACLDAHGLDE